MSSIRITQRLMVAHSLSAMQTSMSRLSRSQEQLSTGRLINRPSDSPTGTNSAMRLRQEIASSTQYARNASDGLGWLGRSDSTLTGMLDSARRARDLIVQGASTGSVGQEARNALASEMDQLRDNLLAQANTQHLGRPLFGGTTGGQVAYNADGTFAGDTSEVTRTVGAGIVVKVNAGGIDAFGPDDNNLFTVLGTAADQLRNNPDALGGSLAALDVVMGQMKTALADVGTRYGRMEAALSLVNNTMLDMQSALSEVENVDIAKAIVDLQMQEVAYQSALGATARVIQPSLIDFLR